jgi:ribosomal protein L29
MKILQEKEELRKMTEQDLTAHACELKKQIVLKTVAARKNELKNVKEIKTLKKRLARAKTVMWQKLQIKEKYEK